MVIFLEGPDRVGKGTQTEKLFGVLHDRPAHLLHYMAPKGFKDKMAAKDWLQGQYSSMFRILVENHGKADFILDRCHVSEMIYAPLYRGYSGDYVLDVEKAWQETAGADFWDQTYLITFIDSPENLIGREDGLSFSKETSAKRAEIEAFKEATEKSLIAHRIIIDINGLSPDMVFANVRDFIGK